MILEMKVPSPGESITEVEIVTWLVKDGDYVEKDQAIAEVDSDKATLELPAEEAGTIMLKANEGDVVAVGQVVCLIDTDAQKPSKAQEKTAETQEKVETPKPQSESVTSSSSKPEPATVSKTDTYARGTPSPAARKILDEKNISPNEVVGSGVSGRITKNDAIQGVPSMGTPPNYGTRETSVQRLTSLRRKVAERLVSVKNETAMLTTFNEVDMSSVMNLRKQHKDAFKEKHGVGLGFMSFFTKAVTRALGLFPDVNAMIDGTQKINYHYCDVSIAVSGPKGLMVPVLRNAELMRFRTIEQEIVRLATLVRDSKISIDEMTGGTFTITNGGTFGSMLSTPIINPPQSGILGLHNIVERPVAINGKVEIRPIMYVALSYDHRIIDGREAVGFLVEIKKAIENPVEILIGGEDKIKSAFEF